MSGRANGVPGGPARGGGLDERLCRRILWAMPTGLYVMGSASGQRRNLMTASLAMQVATEPKLVAVAVDAQSCTLGLVRAGRCFSLSFVAREDRALVRRFVKPVAEETVVVEAGRVVEMAGERVAEQATGAPVLSRSVAWLDCELHELHELGSHALCVGEIVAAGGPGGDMPPVLRMEDTRMSYGG